MNRSRHARPRGRIGVRRLLHTCGARLERPYVTQPHAPEACARLVLEPWSTIPQFQGLYSSKRMDAGIEVLAFSGPLPFPPHGSWVLFLNEQYETPNSISQIPQPVASGPNGCRFGPALLDTIS